MAEEDRITRLEAQVGRLTRLLEERGQSRQADPVESNSHNEEASPTSRRQLLKLASAAAVGAAGASLAAAAPAGATTGNMQFGTNNNAGSDPTGLTASSGPGPGDATLALFNTGSAGSLFAGDEGVGSGFGVLVGLDNTSNSSPAVQGTTMGTGNAVTGTSSGGYGLSGQGGLAPILLVPSATAGPPSTFADLGSIFVDVNGVFYQCVASGIPGTWLRIGFNPLTPVRILDTRNGTGGITGPIGAGQTVSLTVGGANGVATQASAVVLNATVTDTTSASFLTIWPKGATKPVASNLNWSAGETIPNQVTVKLGTGGGISIFNDLGDVQVILDLEGFYS